MAIDIDIKIMLKGKDGQPFLGIGLVWLLLGIDQHRSISRAAREMRLSYPKALRLIRNAEQGLGLDIVARHKGGSERGGAELTPRGREFLRRYERMQQRIRRVAAAAFARELAGFPAHARDSKRAAPRKKAGRLHAATRRARTGQS